MDIREAIRLLAQTRGEMYCKICVVDAVDEGARTVDVSPIDDGAPILGVNLQADQNAEVGVVAFPKKGSHVAVSFLNPETAVVVLCSEIERIEVKANTDVTVTAGGNVSVTNDGDIAVETGGKVSFKVDKTTIEVAKDKAITFNGGDNGGLIVIQKLTDKINTLVDAFNNHTHMLMTGSVAVVGSPYAQQNALPITVPAITAKAMKLSKSDYEDTNIKH